MKFYSKFVFVGLINTVVAYVLFVAFLEVMNYQLAYTLSYLCSIGVSYVLNAKIVFNVAMSLHSFLRFPFVYLAQYLCGITVLYLLNRYTTVANNIGILIVIVLSIPLTFSLSKIILVRKNQTEKKL